MKFGVILKTPLQSSNSDYRVRLLELTEFLEELIQSPDIEIHKLYKRRRIFPSNIFED